ncbi:MAG: ribonuclease E/G [Candidatus Bathyarchaeia archaeon]
MAKARIRGVYSTALTKLLLDNGFDIVAPSAACKERLGLEDEDAAPDITIEDRYDRHGIRTMGSREATDRLRDVLQSNLDDVIVRKWPVSVDGIYKGLLRGVDIPTRSILIDIGVTVGRVPEKEKTGITSREVVVQVKRRRIGAKEPVLSTIIEIPGKYAVLIPKGKVGVSLKICDPDARAKLYELGRELSSADWGVIWRSSAADQPFEKLRDEVKSLVEAAEAVFQRAAQVEAPAMLWEGSFVMDVELPALSKKKLDAVRAKVCSTLPLHHYYKVCGGKIASNLEMAEALLEKGKPKDEVEALFKQQVEAEFPFTGATIEIEHVKTSGLVFYLGKASVELLDDNVVCLRRIFSKEGIYDGLDVKKEVGDVAITRAKLGEWYFQTKYFSKDGKYKGCYVNLNTPIELYPHCVRYVDLEVDVCVLPGGVIKIVDEAKLEKAVNKGYVSEKLAKTVQQKVQEVREMIEKGKDL